MGADFNLNMPLSITKITFFLPLLLILLLAASCLDNPEEVYDGAGTGAAGSSDRSKGLPSEEGYADKGSRDNVSGVNEDAPYISAQDMDREMLSSSMMQAGGWLLYNLNENGSMNYKYLPDPDEYAAQNNMIRQFMATYALSEMYRATGDQSYREAFRRNLDYNLKQYYAEEGEVGYILFRDAAKLGSAAIALMSVIRHDNNAFEDEKEKMAGFIRQLQLDSGRFRTFYLPEGVDINHNYYPGEAMLAMMLLYEESGDESIIPFVERSSAYYQKFFRNSSNPAFVPWQSMAHYHLYRATGKKEYAEFIFEMNDFLVGMQQLDCSEDNRAYGRFYDPMHPEYGPPHSSSTGVYAESLAYAYELAKELGDSERAIIYRDSMLLGIRSLMQLQYSEQNMWGYTGEMPKVLGGIRKTYDNSEMRIDNTQHAVMAIAKALEVLEEKDYSEFRDSVEECPEKP